MRAAPAISPSASRRRSRCARVPATPFAGTIARIGLESDRVTEERRVYVTCQNCPSEMVVGEQAEVVIETGRIAKARLVPENAVHGYDGVAGTVWVVDGGQLDQRRVRFAARTMDARPRHHRCSAGDGGHRHHGRRPGFSVGRGRDGGGGEMNLALADIRHNLVRFLMTSVGLGLLMGVALSMVGIYQGVVSEALALSRGHARGPLGGGGRHARPLRRGLPHPWRRA